MAPVALDPRWACRPASSAPPVRQRPFLSCLGLVKGPYLATEALGAAAVHVTKATVYGRFAAVDAETLLRPDDRFRAHWRIMARIVIRLDTESFVKTVEALLAIAGIMMVLGLRTQQLGDWAAYHNMGLGQARAVPGFARTGFV